MTLITTSASVDAEFEKLLTHAGLIARFAPADFALESAISSEDPIPSTDTSGRQGDVSFWAADREKYHLSRTTCVPPEGIILVAGDHDHTLYADGAVTYAAAKDYAPVRGRLAIGLIRVPMGAQAFVLHAEHGGLALLPGDYAVHRQREYDEAAIRAVID